ncbi:MAG: glycosyltransferase family 4 protein [Betaproteobacteria bacterium]|nr:glycosyltransferase family 4 protein [Betaproteobacteria bacterium]
MKKKVCFVVASPMTLRAFLRPHIEALRGQYALTLVANFGSPRSDNALDLAPTVSLPIRRRIAPFHDLLALIRLVALFRRSGFAAVQSVTPKAGLLAMVAGWIARVPVRVHIFTGQVWVTRRGIARRVLRLMDRVIASAATHVLVDSPSQREFLLAQGVIDSRKSGVLGNGSIAGVDGARFKPDPAARAEVRRDLGYSNAEVVLSYLGRLTRDKGVLDLATAFATIAPGTRARLLVVGPDEEGMVDAMKAALGATAGQAVFVDYTDRPERYLAASDIFCLPSYREGFGATIIEAAACGVPAIGSRIYGVTDAIENDVTGLLHEPRNVSELAACMLRLAGDGELRRRMGEQARARALRDFRTEAITAELMRFYEGALAERETPASG